MIPPETGDFIVVENITGGIIKFRLEKAESLDKSPFWGYTLTMLALKGGEC